MTSTPTGLPPGRATDAALDAVRSVTGAVPAVVTVTAVVVTRGDGPHLPATLAAVRAQSHQPHSVVVVDVGDVPGLVPDLPDGIERLAAPRSRSFGDAVDAALAGIDASGGKDPGWLWLLHDDAAPAPGALAALIRSVEHTTTVAVAGCKQRRWESGDDGAPLDPGENDRGVLLEVGFTVSPLGRRMTGLDDGEIDQGQHDARTDVLAVGLAGALVRTRVWRELGGTDAEYGPFGDSLEFCRRVHLAGHRVTVVPDAVVRHAQVSLHDPATESRRRRAQLRFRLVAATPWLLGWVMVATVVAAPFRAAYRLAVKQPGAVRDELAAPFWMLLSLGGVFRARRRVARTATQPYRVLRPLLGTWRRAAREFRERRLARADARGTGPDDLDRADLRRQAARRRAVLAVVLVTATGLAAAVFGPVLGTLADGGRLVGGALLPASADTGQAWTAATSGWSRPGLGEAGPGDPLLLTLSALAAVAGGSLQAAVNALFVVALPLAALGGWAAAGALTRSVGLRAVAAAVWAAAPGFLGAVSGGLAGVLVAHLALPWVALALVRSVGAQRIDVPARARDVTEGHGRRLGAAGAAGLALAVAVTGAPMLLPVALVVLAAAVFAAPSRRAHLALALLPSLVVCGPLLLHVARTRDVRPLLADPLVPAGAGQVERVAGWQSLLGLPGPPRAWFGGALPAPELAPYLLGGLLGVTALVALLGSRAAGARVGWFLALCALAVVVVPGDVTSGGILPGGALPHGGASTAPVSAILLGLGGAALCATRSARPRLPARAVAALGGGAALGIGLVAAAGLASWYVAGPLSDGGDDGLHATAEPTVPAVGQQMQAPPRQARVLQLGLAADGTVEHALLRADGTQLTDASAGWTATVAGEPAPATGAVDEVAARLAAGTDPDVADQLAALGIGAIQVRTPGTAIPGGTAATEPAPDDAIPGGQAAVAVPDAGTGTATRNAELTVVLDMVPGIERITRGQPVTLWRVRTGAFPAPAWARVESGGTATPIASGGPSVHAEIPAGEPDRVVVLAESAAPGWVATLDGRRLRPVDVEVAGATLQGFELGSGGGRLDVGYHVPGRTAWLAALGLTTAVFVLLALPIPRRRRS